MDCVICVRLRALVCDPAKAPLKQCGKCSAAQQAAKESVQRHARIQALKESVQQNPDAIQYTSTTDWCEETLRTAVTAKPELAFGIMVSLQGSCFEANLPKEHRDDLWAFLQAACPRYKKRTDTHLTGTPALYTPSLHIPMQYNFTEGRWIHPCYMAIHD